MKKKMLFLGLFVTVIAGMFASSNDASAYTIVQNPIPAPLNAHHKEATITAMPGEIVYLPIPRQNFPVRVDVSIPKLANDLNVPFQFGPYIFSFVVTDILDRVILSQVQPNYFGGVLQCSDNASFGATEHLIPVSSEGFGGGAGNGADCALLVDSPVFGVALPEAGMPNRLILTVPNSSTGNPITFYVSAWY